MHILLDLDGTLTNPEEGIVGCILHAFRELGRPPPDCNLTSYIGAPLADVFRELLETDDPRDVDAALAAYRARFATLGMFENEVYPGIPEALATLTAAGARLYLATAPREPARRRPSRIDARLQTSHRIRPAPAPPALR